MLTVGGLAFAASSSTAAQESQGAQDTAASGGRDARGEGLDLEPRHCLSLPFRPRVDVVDDRTIVFYVRGDAYVNYLRLRCPGLAASGSFVSDSRRMCESDWITVVEGFGFTRRAGARCPIGEFLPIYEESAELLVLAAEGDGYTDPYEYEVVELPPQSTMPAPDGEPAAEDPPAPADDDASRAAGP